MTHNRLVHVKMVGEAAKAAGGWEELQSRIPHVLLTFLGDNEWCVLVLVVVLYVWATGETACTWTLNLRGHRPCL
jgi:hypothetical protein